MLHYLYTHTATEATTGYFSCEPSPRPAPEEALLLLAQRPFDDFLRRHILSQLAALPTRKVTDILLLAWPDADFPAPILALLQEMAVLNPALAEEHPLFAARFKDLDPLSSTSLIFLRWQRLPDRETQQRWNAFFAANMREHRLLQSPDENGLPDLYPDLRFAQEAGGEIINTGRTDLPGLHPAFLAAFPVSLAECHARQRQQPENGDKMAVPPAASAAPADGTAFPPRPPAGVTAALAEERLQAQGIIAGPEMRHTASLSPVALLRPWRVRMFASEGRQPLSLEGQGTTYGRGLHLDQARASCRMEMVERASAYLSLDRDGVTDRPAPCPVFHGSRSALLQDHPMVLDPNAYPLEVPYEDQPLHWLTGHTPDNGPVLVPVQMTGLFCNLDEPSLFDSPGSTGIATGCGMAEAKVAALLEILERDAVATTPYSKGSCFLAAADPERDPEAHALLADYAARGIRIQFQDLTGPLGVPVYACFVLSPKGAVAAGHGAGLSGRKAALSALTETPFPYPDGGPSGPQLRKLPTRMLHELPDYSLAHAGADLALLEELLEKNGRSPVYVDLTRKDLGFPVVRAFIPGLELTADGDAFARVPVRLYAAYRRLFA